MTRMIPTLSVVLLTLAGFAFAAEDPSGTWKMTRTFPQIGKSSEGSLKLELNGAELTGVLINRRGTESQISQGTFSDGKIVFTVSNDIGKNKVESKYSGVVMGDTIKGECRAFINGMGTLSNWEAVRQK